MRGNDFVAATYDVRVMRATGGDRLGVLPRVVAVLKANGYLHEAETVVALYGPNEQRFEHCQRLLEAARTAHGSVPERPFEFVEDSRVSQTPRVSIIVSLYKAANKLKTFLRMLGQQPLVVSGEAELVFVDSHSPTEEYSVYKEFAAPMGVRAIYARTAERETIQKAWNRGILLARAPYLAFLGVDEMVRPDCFALLAAELDADPALDWVQGNSVITEVDPHGTLQRDVMIYQRIPYDQDLVYLETCYLSWVGSLYRKSIHDRCGYYDESFGAAGDTEFKNRVLPYIKSKTLPLTLGVFLNYPEERATQSPRAEIEDLRAWYLHRSAAGVQYALAQRSAEDVWPLFKKAIGYRKSYAGHVSSDLDFARAIAEFATQRGFSVIPESCVTAVIRALQAYRELDWMPELSPRAAVRERKRVEQIADAEATVVASKIGVAQLTWSIFNDNRFEQHSNVWQGKPLTGTHTLGERFLWCCEVVSAALSAPASQQPVMNVGAGVLDKAADRFVTTLRQQAQEFGRQGKGEQARDVENVAQYFQALVGGKSPLIPDSAGVGSTLCRVLVESQRGIPFSNTGQFDRRFVDLCNLIAEKAGEVCVDLADGFGALGAEVGESLEQKRLMEIAARLMTYPAPAEAVRRHSTELDVDVLETIQRAANAARLGGNLAYSTRLNAMAVAIKGELEAIGKRGVLSAVA
jgi:glycosyltransferase involved in cell wall biosynthesis